jgi:hypothetical protein
MFNVDSQTIWDTDTDTGRHSNTKLHTADQHERSGKCALLVLPARTPSKSIQEPDLFSMFIPSPLYIATQSARVAGRIKEGGLPGARYLGRSRTPRTRRRPRGGPSWPPRPWRPPVPVPPPSRNLRRSRGYYGRARS